VDKKSYQNVNKKIGNLSVPIGFFGYFRLDFSNESYHESILSTRK